MSLTHTDTKDVYGCAVVRRRRLILALLALVCSAQLVLIAGCHRGFYRRQADAEAKRLVTQKLGARWDSATGDVQVDPMSRMFDPFSADHPPLPPDDPTSRKLMKQVDCKPGYPHWHSNGDIDGVENPDWRSYLPQNEEGKVVLSLSEAYRLALVHSPELQQQRETLYLSALEVSIQRFGFDSQLFAGFNSFLTNRGRFQSGTGSSSTTLESSLGSTGGGLSARRLGITGANFVVGLANTILWEFAGNNTQSANSLINFSVIQPLLRGAGRERILESLTQAERTLLANVRQLERFRRGFYLQIATGRNAGQGPTLNSASFLNQPGIAGANAGGYIGLLQQKKQIKYLEFSVAQFETLLEQFRELFRSNRINSLQVAQFESSVYQQQERLLNLRVNYQDSLDRFKVLLGLPPEVDVVIEDPFIKAFNLIDDRFPERLNAIKTLREKVSDSAVALGVDARALRLEAKAKEDAGEAFEADDSELNRKLNALLPYLMQAQELVTTIKKEDRENVAQNIDQLEQVRGRRLDYLKGVEAAIDSGRLESRVEPGVFTEQSIPTKEALKFQLDDEKNKRSLIAKLDGYLKEIDDRISFIKNGDGSALAGSAYYEKLEDDFAQRFPDLLTEVDGVILELALLQAAARSNLIEIKDVDIEPDQAFEIARCFRRDWMNARSSLVDRWRQIEFFADQLESQVDLVLTGEIGNAGADNPFRIRYEDGNLRAGFRFDAPVVRQAERNTYRQAQIAYQQARRSYYRFEDLINQNLRQTIRNIKQDKILFELNRQNILVTIKQVQLARARLEEPPAPGQQRNLGEVAAQQLIGAINSLTGVQNGYLRLWVEYEVLRRNLDFDMGTMELDPMFEWVDPGKIDSGIGIRVAAREGVAENDRFCCGLGQSQDVGEIFYEMPESSESNDVVEPPAATENNPVNYDSESSTREIPRIEVAPPAKQVTPPSSQDAPVVDPEIELPPLSRESSTRAKREAKIRPIKSFKTTSSSGILDPFRRDLQVQTKSPALKLTSTIGNAVAAELPGSSLERAFEVVQDETSEAVLESPRTANIDAKIRRH